MIKKWLPFDCTPIERADYFGKRIRTFQKTNSMSSLHCSIVTQYGMMFLLRGIPKNARPNLFQRPSYLINIIIWRIFNFTELYFNVFPKFTHVCIVLSYYSVRRHSECSVANYCGIKNDYHIWKVSNDRDRIDSESTRWRHIRHYQTIVSKFKSFSKSYMESICRLNTLYSMIKGLDNLWLPRAYWGPRQPSNFLTLNTWLSDNIHVFGETPIQCFSKKNVKWLKDLETFQPLESVVANFISRWVACLLFFF